MYPKDITIKDEGDNIVLLLNTDIAKASFNDLFENFKGPIDIKESEIELPFNHLNKVFIWAFGHELSIESRLQFKIH